MKNYYDESGNLLTKEKVYEFVEAEIPIYEWFPAANDSGWELILISDVSRLDTIIKRKRIKEGKA